MRKKTTAQFIVEARIVHGDKYDYSRSVYLGSRDKIEIICPEHGSFWQVPDSHVSGKCGCPKCTGESVRVGRGFDKNTFDVERAHAKHGDAYDYSKVIWVNSKTKVEIICPEHGSFWQTPGHHYQGCGCPECGKLKSADGRRFDTETFIEKARAVHGDDYDYSHVTYGNDNTCKVEIICPEHGSFWQAADNHLFGQGCPKCAVGYGPSKGEQEVFEYVRNICPDAEQSVVGLLDGRHELDIVIPSLKVAIEFNGLIWHSEKYGKGRTYHQDKTDAAVAAGYRLIHIWADEWRDKRAWCEAFLDRLCGAPNRKIYARKCKVTPLHRDVSRPFLDANHLQGARDGSHIGLFFGDELVAVATHGRNSIGEHELLRWCVKLGVSVVGGFSKIMAHIPAGTISFCDTAKHNGDGYLLAGWELVSKTAPMYHYTDGKVRFNRQRFQKSKLGKRDGVVGTSEREMANSLGYYQIGGLRQLKFAWRS